MESIQLNHSQILQKTVGLQLSGQVELGSAKSEAIPSTIVEISAVAHKLIEGNRESRFSSDEERDAHLTKLANTMLTYEDLQSGKHSYENEEDQRLGQLSMKELLIENYQSWTESGELGGVVSESVRSDRHLIAKGNLDIEAAFQFEKSREFVTLALDNFREKLSEKIPSIDPDSYDIVYQDGEITAIAKGSDGATDEELEKIQKLLDDPGDNPAAKRLVNSIEQFNKASLEVVNLEITKVKYRGAYDGNDPYIPESYSMEQVMQDFSYSDDVEASNHMSGALTDMYAGSRERYHTALEDGSHADLQDPGLRALTEMREAMLAQGPMPIRPPIIDAEAKSPDFSRL